ncbi:MAG TPA: hypothetical protein VGX16_02010, partial [Solirubrobacteraceae bacterium]|nr:hypothetical protein [Solirubrobacteraceae bacterium]
MGSSAWEARAIGSRVRERIGGLPGGRELLELAALREDVDLVGGAVRDVILARTPRELDVVVGGDAIALAGRLAAMLGTEARVHERFGT